MRGKKSLSSLICFVAYVYFEPLCMLCSSMTHHSHLTVLSTMNLHTIFHHYHGSGLGLLLTEIAGGRDDGVGITIIEEVLDDGNSAGSGIIAGDSIVALSITKTKDDGTMNVIEERVGVSTECLGYDATIDAITSLPPSTSSDDEITLTVKRIRKQPKINVKLQYPPYMEEEDVSIELFAGENLRRAMLTRGIKLNDKLVSCVTA